MKNNIEINNRQAGFNYTTLYTYVAGIALTGCEVKSIRNGNANISESYCIVTNNSVLLKNSYIKEYIQNGHSNYNTTRDRQLLLQKKEIDKIRKGVAEKGNTVIPLKIFFNEKGKAKLLIAVCKGKHTYDKREYLKEKDIERESKREM